ncbi:hypothetical protein [Lentibacillus kapialis]|uniref:hypothetical protein n=1 Tax=Lentibacillus kapialis TaxID=340214 RepID=UPI00166D3015|nr:hypothetical protein [Lentibacillus kapialis]
MKKTTYVGLFGGCFVLGIVIGLVLYISAGGKEDTGTHDLQLSYAAPVEEGAMDMDIPA